LATDTFSLWIEASKNVYAIQDLYFISDFSPIGRGSHPQWTGWPWPTRSSETFTIPREAISDGVNTRLSDLEGKS